MGNEPLVLNDGIWTVTFYKNDAYVGIQTNVPNERIMLLRHDQAHQLREWLENCLPIQE